MADHHADGAVVDRVIGIGVVERRLENGRREADLVGRGIVVGVDRLRRHEPFVLVDRLAELAQIVERAPQARGLDVLPVALGGIDRERRIVLPLVGIADLDVERRQLLLRLGLRGVRHPVESGDVLAERRLQVPDQFEHPLLVLGREVFGDVHLAYGLAQHRVGDRHGAFPAGTLLLLAGHLTAEEVERSGIEVVAQVGGRAGEVLSGQVVAQRLDRGLFDQFVHPLEETRLSDDGTVDPCDLYLAQFIEKHLPVDGVVSLFEVGDAHRIVAAGDVAQLDVRPRGAGQFGFEGHDVGCGPLRLSLLRARKDEEFGEQLLVAFFQGGVRLFEVVVAVTHAQTALFEVEGVGVAVHQVGHHAEGEERIAHVEHHLRERLGQRGSLFDLHDRGQVGLDRFGALLVQTYRIEPHFVEVGDLLVDRTRRGLDLGHLLKEVVDAHLVVLAQHVE